MRIPPLPLSSLPAWSKLNNVEFLDATVSVSSAEKLPTAGRNDPFGYIQQNGIFTTRALSTVDTFDIPTILEVPKDLILGRDFLLEMGRVDPHFKQLVELVGGKSTRGDVMLFLLIQMTIARNNMIIDCTGFEESASGKCKNCDHSSQECLLSTVASQSEENINIGVKNPWSEYIRFLPEKVPVPTMWNEEEQMLLEGTSLETAVVAKMAKLSKEFEDLREKTIGIPWCYSCWWDQSVPLLPLELWDWVRLDAWYRSRSLELPNVGGVMVPCLDMANHSGQSNAFWDQTSNGNVSLVLRGNIQLDERSEVTINYGPKSNAENIFSYGFIDQSYFNGSLVLEVEPAVDDPLRIAKVVAFRKRPSLRISLQYTQVLWECPFLYMACLNEEDGLEFKTLQEVDGSHNSLRVFWQEKDVTDSIEEFETLIRGHRLVDVFKLRVATLVYTRVLEQLDSLDASKLMVDSLLADEMVGVSIRLEASALRKGETHILNAALKDLNEQRLGLLQIESVSQYLNSGQNNNEEDELSPEIYEEDELSPETNEEDELSPETNEEDELSPETNEEDDFS
ncbi:hypothetical protein NHQ30_007502 [Ciborinia camelliae]|nr:hypothetical protein NHQ30_007502 [Ciborinia camelliae]